MPKRSRTSHIPSQIRRRKPRRPNDFTNALAESQAFRNLAEAEAAAVPMTATATPVAAAPRMGRRLEAATRSREGFGGRTAPGQLPTFERSYLIRELTQIAAISGSLLLLIIVLAVIMR